MDFEDEDEDGDEDEGESDEEDEKTIKKTVAKMVVGGKSVSSKALWLRENIIRFNLKGKVAAKPSAGKNVEEDDDDDDDEDDDDDDDDEDDVNNPSLFCQIKYRLFSIG
jgi:hypothetical protein